MNYLLLEEYNLKADAPVDMNTAAFVGSRIAMKEGERLAILVNMDTSLAAVVEFTLKQHNAAAAGTSKDLATTTPYFKKIGAATSFTKVELASPTSNFVLSADLAAAKGVVVFEVLASELDVNGDFNYVSIEALDSTAAKLMGVTYVLRNCKHTPPYSIAL